MKKRLLYLFMSALLLMGGLTTTQAQTAAQYNFSASSGTYTALSGGTSIAFSNSDDDIVKNIAIGFPFKFAGTDYTYAHVCLNGFLVLATVNGANISAVESYTNTNFADILAYPIIAPLWDDLATGGTTYQSDVTYQLSGVSPNRVFTVQWKDMHWNLMAPGPVISFQVKLYEGSNKIEYIYKPSETEPINTSSGGATIGICSAPDVYLSLNNTSASPTASSTVYTSDIITKPANGQIYTFTGSPIAPTITGVSPTSGSTAGGTAVTITGTNLTGTTAVNFGGTAGSITANTVTSITATSPAGSAGAVDITVTTAGGTSATSASDQFTYVVPPTATTSAATSINSAGATLRGSVNANNSSTAVTFEYGLTTSYGTTVTATQSPVTGASASAVSYAVSGLNPNTIYHFRVNGVNSAVTTNGLDQTFTTLVAPTITGISPTSGSTAGGTSVTITGTYFTGVTAVKFGSTNASSFTVNSTNSITATSPAGSAGAVDITVTTAGGTSATSASDQFTYVAPPTATTSAATSISSAGATLRGSVNANNSITAVTFEYGLTTIYGTTVTATQSPITGSAATAVSTAISGLLPNTTYHFRVNGVNTVGTTNGLDQTFTTSVAAPTITGVLPKTGPTTGSTSVIITGTYLTASTAVKFGNTNADSYVVNSASQITAISPAGTIGTVDITVTTAGGTSSTNINDKFTYVIAPSFTTTPVTTVGYDQTYNYNVAATTEGGLATTIAAPTLPAWLTVSGQKGDGTPKLIGNIPAGVQITGVTEDNDGNTYAITFYDDNNTTLNTIYKITPDGTTTIWKSGLISGVVYELHIANGYIYIPRYMGSINSITRIPLNNPDAVEENFASLTSGALALTDHGGWIYVSDYYSGKIFRINETTKAIETILSSSDGVPIHGPFGLDFDQNGNLFIATYEHKSILKYNTATSTLSTVLSGLPNNPTSVKVDKQGNYYVALESGGLRKYKPDFSSYELVSLNATVDVWGLFMTETGAITHSILGTNLVYHLETGVVLHGTPAKSDVGAHNVVLRATNSAGYTDQAFTINVVDNVAPVVSTYSPATNATNIALQPTLSLTFDEKVSLGSTGTLSIYNGATLVKLYDLSVAADQALFTLSADKKTVSITLTENLPVNSVLSIGLGAGFVKDEYGNSFAGFTAASNTWRFTTVNMVAQTITFPAIIAKTYGDADFTLGNATTDKGLTVTYTAADPTVVRITGNQATILKAGNTNIIATQTGDNGTFAASQVEHSLSVSKALLTVKADNKSKVYDGQVADNFTVTYTGFVKDETASALTGTLSFTGTAVTAVTVGLDYIVTPSGYSSDNYTITYENGKLDISKCPITLTADAKSKTYGDADPSLTAQVTSGTIVTGDNASGSLTRATGETVADYAISKGTYTYGSNYDETYVSKNLSITKRPLSVTAKIDSKTYDGTTKSSQIPIVGALVTGDVVNVVPIQLFDNANVGNNHVLTPSGLTLKNGTNNVTDNYLITYNTLSTGVITAKQLTISNPTVTTNKTVDGNTSAAITKVGTLTGIETIDANNVTVAAVANYNNAAVGIGKTITVVYTLNGSANGNYIAPANFVITNGKISDVVTLSPLLTPSPECEGSGLNLDYSILTGTPTQYKITFDAAANSAGIQNVAYTDMPSTTGTLTINIPRKTVDGTYHGTLTMRDELGVESSAYAFTFTINLSSDYLLTKFDQIIFVDNSSNRFAAYQWYKNGVIINGATKQSYNDPAGLVGAYSVQVTDIKGHKIFSCTKELNLTKAVKVIAYPNPVKASQTCTVQVSGLSGKDLDNAELSVYTSQGACIYQSSKVENLNYLKLPTVDGVYLGQLKTTDGDKHIFKIVVIK